MSVDSISTETSISSTVNTSSPIKSSSDQKHTIATSCGSHSPTDIRSYPHEEDEEDKDNDLLFETQQEKEHVRMTARDRLLDEGDSFHNSLSRLGDLPIVNENSTLDEEEDNEILMSENIDDLLLDGEHDDHGSEVQLRHDQDVEEDDLSDSEYDEEIRNSYLDYQIEQEELQKEMNINKIAFAAYRNAVLHLVHNQTTFSKKKRSDEKDEEDDNDDDNDDVLTTNTDDEANERMNMLEDLAKDIVETKARACFEAVEIVKEFNLRRDEKRQRSKMLVGGLAGVGGEDRILIEFRKMNKSKKASSGVASADGAISSNIDTDEIITEKVTHEPVVVKKDTKPISSAPKLVGKDTKLLVVKKDKKMPASNQEPTKSIPMVSKLKCKISFSLPTAAGPSLRREPPSPVGPIVRLKKKPTRHPDCIKHTLPKFEYKNNSSDDCEEKDEASLSAKYATSSWIRSMVTWRIEKMNHEESMLKRCGCPDCKVDLSTLHEKRVARAC